jgi:hypothetical protein
MTALKWHTQGWTYDCLTTYIHKLFTFQWIKKNSTYNTKYIFTDTQMSLGEVSHTSLSMRCRQTETQMHILLLEICCILFSTYYENPKRHTRVLVEDTWLFFRRVPKSSYGMPQIFCAPSPKCDFCIVVLWPKTCERCVLFPVSISVCQSE